jgi:hypothetical protein
VPNTAFDQRTATPQLVEYEGGCRLGVDQYAYLGHFYSAIEGELGRIEADVEVLIRDMNRAIEEAGSFIESLNS